MSHRLCLLPVTGNYISELIILVILKSSARQRCGYRTLAVLVLMKHPLWREDGFCLLLICLAFRQVYISHIFRVTEKCLLLHYTQVLCQYRLCRADHTYLTYLMLLLNRLNGRKLDHRQVQASYVFGERSLTSKLCYDRRSAGQSVLVSSTHLWLTMGFLLLSDNEGFVDVGRSLWRENGSAIYNCCRAWPAQSYSSPSPAGLVTIFYCLRLETPPAWKARSLSLYPPDTGFAFRRLLRLTWLRWRYSNPPPPGELSSDLIPCL
jgi:hypothetical protein